MPSTLEKSNNIKNVDLEKRLNRLESEVNEMKKNTKSNINHNHTKLRFWVSSLLIFISAVFFVFSIAGFWLKSNIIKTDEQCYKIYKERGN